MSKQFHPAIARKGASPANGAGQFSGGGFAFATAARNLFSGLSYAFLGLSGVLGILATSTLFGSSPALAVDGSLDTGGYKVYYGSFHAHTSEGGDDNKRSIATVEFAYEFARDRGGLDFFGLTPHSHMISDAFHATLARQSQQYKTGSFVPIWGSEWGVMSSTGHFGTLFTKTIPTNRLDPIIDPYDHLASYFAWLQGQKEAVVVLNHPEVFDFGYFYNPLADGKIRLVEAFSGSAFETRVDMVMGSKSYADQLLILLNRGWHTGMCGNQDNHLPTYGLATQTRTGVLARGLDTKSIREALFARRCFATQDKNLAVTLSARVNGKTRYMGEQVTGAKGQVLIRIATKDSDGEGVKTINLYSDAVDCGELGRRVASVSGASTLEYETVADSSDRFFVAEIIQEDGHAAWTSPIWITSFSPFQCDLVQYLIAKKQHQSVRQHLAHVSKTLGTRTDPYVASLESAAGYLEDLEETLAEEIYEVITSAKGEKLRGLIVECGDFLKSVPVWDAVIFIKDLREIAARVSLTTEEGEFIKAFVKETNEKFKDLKLDAEAMAALAENLRKAKNYNTAALIYHTLMTTFPERADEWAPNLMALYSSLEAYQAVISVGDQLLSTPGLDTETAVETYMAKGQALMRKASREGSTGKVIAALELARKQFLQLLKDYPRVAAAVKAEIEELAGDCSAKLMGKDKANKETHYKEAAKYYNKALGRSDETSHVFDLNAKISGITLSLDSSEEKILEVIEDFRRLMSDHAGSREADMFLKNLGDLYSKLGKAITDPADKKECFQEAVDLYRRYAAAVKPRVMDTLNFEVGVILMALGQNSKAKAYFEKIERENLGSRKLEWSLFNIAQCLEGMKKYSEAKTVLTRLLKEFPNFDLCWQNSSKKEVLDIKESVAGMRLEKLKALASGDLDDLDGPPFRPDLKSQQTFFFVPESLDGDCGN